MAKQQNQKQQRAASATVVVEATVAKTQDVGNSQLTNEQQNVVASEQKHASEQQVPVTNQQPEVVMEQQQVTQQQQPAAPVQLLRRATDVAQQYPQPLRRATDVVATQAASAPVATEQPKRATRADVAAREVRNGVRRPSETGLCGQAWQVFDELRAQLGRAPAIQEALELGAMRKLHPGNVKAEYAAWRKFNGISGRIAPATPAPRTTKQQIPVAALQPARVVFLDAHGNPL